MISLKAAVSDVTEEATEERLKTPTTVLPLAESPEQMLAPRWSPPGETVSVIHLTNNNNNNSDEAVVSWIQYPSPPQAILSLLLLLLNHSPQCHSQHHRPIVLLQQLSSPHHRRQLQPKRHLVSPQRQRRLIPLQQANKQTPPPHQSSSSLKRADKILLPPLQVLEHLNKRETVLKSMGKMSDRRMLIHTPRARGALWRRWNAHSGLGQTIAALAAAMPMNSSSSLGESWPTLRGTTLLAVNKHKWPVAREESMAESLLLVPRSLNCLTCQTCHLIPKVVLVVEDLPLKATTISETTHSSSKCTDVEAMEEAIDKDKDRRPPQECLLPFPPLVVATNSRSLSSTMTSIITHSTTILEEKVVS